MRPNYVSLPNMKSLLYSFLLTALLSISAAQDSKPTETPQETAARIAKFEKIADHALEQPTLNTSPLPKYDYDQLDYGMTIGIERTPGGRIWACWVAGGDSPDAFFVLATSDDHGENWSKPRLVVDTHSADLPRKRSTLVGNLWTDPTGRLWLIFDQSMDMFDGRGGVWVTTCKNPDDGNPQWSKPRRIWHGVTLNKPTVLSNGEWMMPISLDQRGGFGPFKGSFSELDAMRGANVFVSADQGETWNRRGMATFPHPNWHEHMIVERRDESLWMLARTGKGIMESTSTDRGKSWSTPVASAINHPVARFFIRRLASGRLVLIKHGDQIDAHEGRVQLSAWLSEDDGKTWQGGLVLDQRKGVSYPDGFQAPDGQIFISYDRNRATDGEILLARFTEEDVLAKKIVSPRSKLKMLISRPLALAKKKKKKAAAPHPATNPTSPLMLVGDGVPANPSEINFDKLPRVPAEHVIISDVRDQGGTRVHQHAYLARFGGRFWAMWSDGPGKPNPKFTPRQHRDVVPGHDRPGTRVSFATSVDGLKWTKPGDLSGPPRREDFGWISRGMWLRDGELLALASHFHAPGYAGEGLSLEAFRWDEKNKKWIAHGTVLDDSMNNFPPKKLPTGEWMMTRRDHQRQVSVMIGGVKSFNDWKVKPLASYDGNGRPEEPYWYLLPDEKNIVGLIRDNGRSGRLLRTFSTDSGRTWTPITKTNFPDATSKFFVHRTSRGYYVLVSNSNPRRRDPLTLAVSKDGLVFDRLYYLIGGRHIDYPHIIEHDGHLLIAFSGAKQTMEVMKVSLDELEKVDKEPF